MSVTTVRRRQQLYPPAPHWSAIILGGCFASFGAGAAFVLGGAVLAVAATFGGVGGVVGFGISFYAIWQDIKPAAAAPSIINTGAVIVESRQGTNITRVSLLPPGFDRDAAIKLARMVVNNPTLTNRAGARVGLTGAQMAEWRQHWVSHKWAARNSETDARAGYSITTAGVEKMAELARAEVKHD